LAISAPAADKPPSGPWEAITFPKGETRIQIRDPAEIPWLIRNVLDRDRCDYESYLSHSPITVIKLSKTTIALAHCPVSAVSRPVLLVFDRGTNKEPRILDLPRMADGSGFSVGGQRHGNIEWDAVPGALTITQGSDISCDALRYVYEYRDSGYLFALTQIQLSQECGGKNWTEFWHAPSWSSVAGRQ